MRAYFDRGSNTINHYSLSAQRLCLPSSSLLLLYTLSFFIYYIKIFAVHFGNGFKDGDGDNNYVNSLDTDEDMGKIIPDSILLKCINSWSTLHLNILKLFLF